ncbi:fatty acid hydroxylase [Fibrisoma limi BUZ 3]|uniref:Fatty acid hydroxylase n=1 Tax=Fibrisoma limi BUZ 3 TaxID=1185876 RepID=I2GBU1_9BACT|nr:sterol desaturase family protein [Fibrisoma limi]CCH51365.1 fatty acid hydroxylase [Fibrisoma limi BUZ 3]
MTDILQLLVDELTGFLGIHHWMEMFRSGDYQSLLTWKGIQGALSPLIPLLLLIELIRGSLYRNFKVENYKLPFLTYIFNRFVSRYLSISAVAYCIALFEEHALLKTTLTWYWFLYGYVVWELAHFVYHYLGHKVRLLWCLHATHHAPEDMNLSVTYAHFFLEAPYADVIRTTICLLLGVNPPLLFLIMFIDGTWGSFIHVGENLLKDGRLGFLNGILLTPSHHRVHHAKNPLYMDTNFCNLLPIWDKAFGTLQTEEKELPIEYGISRQIRRGHFGDAYFGEFYALFNDIRRAPGLKNKLLYVVMPPGWSHTGDHKTAKVVRHNYRQQATGEPVAQVS